MTEVCVEVDVQVCQHHAAAVAQGSGCAQKLRCSYHGWEYGRLLRITSLAMSYVRILMPASTVL